MDSNKTDNEVENGATAHSNGEINTQEHQWNDHFMNEVKNKNTGVQSDNGCDDEETVHDDDGNSGMRV